MSVAFWSTKLTTDGKSVVVQPPENFVLIVTNAALDIESNNKGNVGLKITTDSIDGSKDSAILCTLNGEKFPQHSLNLCLGYDVESSFSLVGAKDAKGTVFLSGYFQPAPDNEGDGMDYDDEEGMFDEDDSEEDDDEDDDEEDEDDESEDEIKDPRVEELGPVDKKAPVKAAAPAAKAAPAPAAKAAPAAKPAVKAATGPAKKSVPEPDTEDAVTAKEIKRMIAEAQAAGKKYDEDHSDDEEDEDDDSEEDDSEEDSEEDDSEDDEEDLPPMKVQKTQPQGFSAQKGANNNNNKTPSKPAAPAPKTPQTGNAKAAPQSGNKVNNKTPNQQQQVKTPQTNNKPGQNPQSGNKNNNGPKSGDKRKR